MSVKDIAPYKGKRRKLLEVLANAENAELGVEAVCQQTGLSRATYYKYIGEVDFQSALRAIVTRSYARMAPQIASSMIKAAKKGNVKAAMLIFQTLRWIEPVSNSQVVNIAQTGDNIQTYDTDADALAALEAEQTARNDLIKTIRERVGARQDDGHGIHPKDKDA